jgi:aspartate oxidase
LASKSPKEIIIFLSTQNNQDIQKDNLKNENKVIDINSNKTETIEKQDSNNEKISKLQSIFTPELLDQHTTLKTQFEKLDTTTDKEKVFREIINTLKDNPQTLASIVNEIG